MVIRVKKPPIVMVFYLKEKKEMLLDVLLILKITKHLVNLIKV